MKKLIAAAGIGAALTVGSLAGRSGERRSRPGQLPVSAGTEQQRHLRQQHRRCPQPRAHRLLHPPQRRRWLHRADLAGQRQSRTRLERCLQPGWAGRQSTSARRSTTSSTPRRATNRPNRLRPNVSRRTRGINERKIHMKKIITATLLGGAIIGSLFGAASANAESAGQRNAVRSAESYVDMTGFSRSGLIEQLEYEDFSAADATYARRSRRRGLERRSGRERPELPRHDLVLQVGPDRAARSTRASPRPRPHTVPTWRTGAEQHKPTQLSYRSSGGTRTHHLDRGRRRCPDSGDQPRGWWRCRQQVHRPAR